MALDVYPFPLELSALSVRSTWQTTVVQVAGGSEQRAVLWSDARRRYDANNPNLTLVQYLQIVNHFNARRGRGRAYPLRDRTSYRALTQALGTAGGIGSTMQLAVASGDAGNAYSREIFLPETGTIHVYANAVEKTETTDWTLAYTGTTGGLLTWVTSVSGQSITWSGDYWIPVRYEIDEMPDSDMFIWKTDGTGIVSGPSIPMIEVRYADEFV